MSAAALYLHLRALNIRLALVPDPEAGYGYRLRATWPRDIAPAEHRRTRALIVANRDAMLALMLGGSPAALAVHQEGRYVLPLASPDSRRLMEPGGEA